MKKLNAIESGNIYKENISKSEKTYIASHDNKDFYYMYDGINHNIEFSNCKEPKNYSNFTIIDNEGKFLQDKLIDSIIPKWIQFKAIEMIDVSF